MIFIIWLNSNWINKWENHTEFLLQAACFNREIIQLDFFACVQDTVSSKMINHSTPIFDQLSRHIKCKNNILHTVCNFCSRKAKKWCRDLAQWTCAWKWIDESCARLHYFIDIVVLDELIYILYMNPMSLFNY